MTKRVIHMSEDEAASDFASLLARVRAGAEVVIEHNAHPVAVVSPAGPEPRMLSEAIASAKAHEEEIGYAPMLDADFAEDLEKIVANRKSWNPSSWE